MAKSPKNKAKTNRISRKQAELNKEYNKQRNRIKKFLKSAEGRGFIFWAQPVTRKNNKRTGESQVVFPKGLEEFSLPDRPKKITEASINKLKKITTQYLYQRSVFLDITTGEAFTGSEGVAIERSRRSKKAAETRKRKKRIYTEPDYLDGDGSYWYEDSIPDPPSGDAYDYILDEIMPMLQSLAPAEDRYTKKGNLWAVDEARKTWSNALVKTFLRIQDEESSNGTMAEYCDYLVSVADKINGLLEEAKISSKAESVAANCERIMKLLNRGEHLQPHEEDALQRYVMGEIDEL